MDIQAASGNRALGRLLAGRGLIQRKCACSGGGSSPCQCEEEDVQTKLVVNEPGDEYEREADAVADRVMRTVPPGTPTAVPSISSIQRSAAGSDVAHPGAGVVLESQLAAVRTGGRPIEPSVRAPLETQFGRDFASVRIHTGTAAAAFSDDLNALAFTHGRDVYFAQAMYAPHTVQGRRLLAHELTHVVQQGGVGRAVQRNGRRRPPTRMHVLCNELLDAEGAPVNGRRAHDAIRSAFVAELGPAGEPIGDIPLASWSHYRTACGDSRPSRRERGVTVGGRAGDGEPDLTYRRDSGVVEVAEIKPAHPTCIPEAEGQVHHYVNVGKSGHNGLWRRRRRITGFELMPVGRSTLRHVAVDQRPVTLSWCAPGILVYKAVRDTDNLIVCGVSSEQLDRALNLALDPAQAAANRALSEGLDRSLDRVIDKMTIRDGINRLWRVAKPSVRRLLTRTQGFDVGPLLDALGSDAAVDQIGKWLEASLGSDAQALIRSIAHGIKAELMQRVRAAVQRELRTLLQEAILAACAAALAGVVTLEDVIRQFLERLRRRLGQIVAEEALVLARELARRMAEALAKGLAAALLVAIAAVVIIVFLPEILAALGIGEALAAIGSALVAMGEAIAAFFVEFWPVILGLGPALERALRGLAPAVSPLLPALGLGR